MKKLSIATLSLLSISAFSAVNVEISSKTAVLKMEGQSKQAISCPSTTKFELSHVNSKRKVITLKRSTTIADGRESLFKELVGNLPQDAADQVQEYYYQPRPICLSIGLVRGHGLVDVSGYKLEAGTWRVETTDEAQAKPSGSKTNHLSGLAIQVKSVTQFYK